MEGVHTFINRCLHGRVAGDAQSMASFLFDQTQGSPLYLGGLMSTLVNERVLTFDFDALIWRFDLISLQDHLADAGIDAYLLRLMRALPADAQQLLMVRRYAYSLTQVFILPSIGRLSLASLI
jgi:predicted ATPase